MYILFLKIEVMFEFSSVLEVFQPTTCYKAANIRAFLSTLEKLQSHLDLLNIKFKYTVSF